MESRNDPFATPSRASSTTGHEEPDPNQIGVALTADVRRSPTPSGHRTTSSVSTTASHASRTSYLGVVNRQRQGSDATYSSSARRSSSADSARSGGGYFADAETPRSRRGRRPPPPVSMPRHLDVQAEQGSPHGPPGTSFDTRWPASPHAAHAGPSRGIIIPDIEINSPTPPGEQPRPASETRHHPSAESSEALDIPQAAQHRSIMHHPHHHDRRRAASTASSGSMHSRTSRRPRSLKVAFAETSTVHDSGDSRAHSVATNTGSPPERGLLRPPRSVAPPARNPFDDSFGFATDGSRTSSDGASSSAAARRRPSSHGRRQSSDAFGFLRRVSRRRRSSLGPLDNSSRNASVTSTSTTSGPSQRPSLSGPQPHGPDGEPTSRPHGHQRSKSLWDRRPSFRDPFRRHSQSTADSRPTRPRRASDSDLHRRPSMSRRLTSMILPEDPIPSRYRTRSVSNLAYFIAPLEKNNRTIPIFEERIEAEKENVEEFLAAVEVLQAKAARKPWQSNLFKLVYFVAILCVIYFVFVGQPLWDGLALIFYRWVNSDGIARAGSAVFMSWAAFQAFLPMLGTRFEQDVDDVERRDASEVALVIPAYKAAAILPETIGHALKIFRPEQIFIMANGNSPTPLDNTAEVCREFGVNVAWVPIGSKITAEFVGVALTSKYKYILLIDDDVHLPPNLPIVTDRMVGNTKCVGYTIKSTGPNGSKGSLIQQCQDMEYKLSGLTRTFCGKYGSATFPHGAIILWDRATLQSLFNVHPGYAISEDWFFGYSARASGYRITFCSQVFVETETPPSLFFTAGPARGGFGEMTVFKQRFFRWNFFWSHRLWEDSIYILFSWRLGWREAVTKIWVLVELYDCVMSFLRPFVIVLAAIANWQLLLIFIAALTGMYAFAFILFNSWHLRKKNEMIAWKIMPVYMTMKFILLWMNTASVYYDLYCYAKYFSVKHPRVIETRAVLEAAYQARLGPNMVPLDAQLGDATASAEAETSEKVEPAEPLQGVLPLASAS